MGVQFFFHNIFSLYFYKSFYYITNSYVERTKGEKASASFYRCSIAHRNNKNSAKEVFHWCYLQEIIEHKSYVKKSNQNDTHLVENITESESFFKGQDPRPQQPQYITQSQFNILETQLGAMMTLLLIQTQRALGSSHSRPGILP